MDQFKTNNKKITTPLKSTNWFYLLVNTDFIKFLKANSSWWLMTITWHLNTHATIAICAVVCVLTNLNPSRTWKTKNKLIFYNAAATYTLFSLYKNGVFQVQATGLLFFCRFEAEILITTFLRWQRGACIPYFFTYIFTLYFGSSWASKPVKFTDDVEQKKSKEPWDHYTITKPHHELSKQRINITGSYTEVNPVFYKS